MRKWLLNKVNQVLALCLSALGLAGCMAEKYGVPEPVCMYGTPYATFDVEGYVTNESTEPVEGVKVEVRELFKVTGEEQAVAVTDAEGHYKISNRSIETRDSIWIYANDTTGVYAPDSAKVRITYDRSHKDAWYEGDGFAKADFVLRKK